MEPIKKGDILHCENCSVELSVIKSCDGGPCEFICCGKPMNVKKGMDEEGGKCCAK